MKNYSNAREYLSGQLWAIRPETLSIMADILELRISGNSLSTEEINSRLGAAQKFNSKPSAGSIAILPLYGVIDQKVSSMQQISGGTAVDDFMGAFRSALADDDVSGILLDVDSPGGSVSGVPEAAAEILAARGKKPIVAIANTTIASAAYWIASAADQMYSMPSGQVGSVGVISVHEDISAANEQAGYKATYITYGQFKGEGNSDTPLSEDAKAYRQGQVNTMGDMFTRSVAKARGVSVDAVRNDFGQGRMLLAKDALKMKMIDGIATMEQVISNMTKPQPATSALKSEENLPKMKVKDVSDKALVELSAATKGWGDLVDRRIASGKHPEPLLSKVKADSLLLLQKTLRESAAQIDGIVIRAKLSEPPAVAIEEPKSAEPTPKADRANIGRSLALRGIKTY